MFDSMEFKTIFSTSKSQLREVFIGDKIIGKVTSLSHTSERILILVFLWCKATNFRVIGGDCRLADSSGVSRPGNWIPFDSIS